MISDEDIQKTVIQILTQSVTRKMGIGISFQTNDTEDEFFRELVKKAIEVQLNPKLFCFEPMSNGSFSVSYGNYPIGKIKLNGSKTYMQVLKGLTGIKEFENLSLEECVSHIADWIRHIKYCLKD